MTAKDADTGMRRFWVLLAVVFVTALVVIGEIGARGAPKLAPSFRLVPGKARVGGAVVALLFFGFWAIRSEPALATAAHPFIDYSNYARAICSPRSDGTRPTSADFERARRLLDRADPDETTRRLLLLDARLWVECFAAVELDDPVAAMSAYAAAEDLLKNDLSPGQPGYSDRFLGNLIPSMRMRVGAIASQPFVREDPALRGEAQRLLSRLR